MLTRITSRFLVAVRRAWLAPVRFYQRVLSPLTPPSCRYVPSCSQYAIDAVERRGVIVGTFLAVWRVVRCNPLLPGGHDPVTRRAISAPEGEGCDSSQSGLCDSQSHAHEQGGCS